MKGTTILNALCVAAIVLALVPYIVLGTWKFALCGFSALAVLCLNNRKKRAKK